MKRVAMAVGALLGVGLMGCGTANYQNEKLVYGMNQAIFEPRVPVCEQGVGGAGTGGAGETAPLEVNEKEREKTRTSTPMPGGYPGMRIIIENERVVGG